MEDQEVISGLPKSVKQAKAVGSKHYYTGKPCARGHIAKRFTSTRKCLLCSNFYCRGQYAANPEHNRKRVREWYAANQSAAIQRMQIWRNNNRDKSRAASLRWSKNNAARVLANQNARRARLLRACPAWVCQDTIRKVYEERKQLSVDTGVAHHVDHIIPLRGKNVCGLHVPWNLRIIPAADNIRKGNRIDDELLEELYGSA